MSVAKRLVLAFGLIVVLLAGVCALGFGNALHSQRSIEQTLAPAQARQDAAGALLNRALQQDVAIRNIGLFEDPAAMQREAAELKRLDEQIAALLQGLAASATEADDRSDIDQVRALGEKAASHYAKAVALALAFQPQDAVAVLGKHVAPLSVERAATLTRFAERQRTRAAAAASSIERSGSTARMLLAASGVVGLLIATLCGWLVTRSVTLPLATALMIADRVAAGDLGGSAQASDRNARTDEIGRLLDALEGVDDAAGREADIAAVDEAECRDGIEVGVGRVEAPHQHRLGANRIGTAAGADAERMRAAVERDPENRRPISGTRPAVRGAHECSWKREQLLVGHLGHCALLGCDRVSRRGNRRLRACGPWRR